MLGKDNTNAHPDNIVFTIKVKKCMSVLSFYQQKLSNFLSIGFARSAYWNKYKAKTENKDTTNE